MMNPYTLSIVVFSCVSVCVGVCVTVGQCVKFSEKISYYVMKSEGFSPDFFKLLTIL